MPTLTAQLFTIPLPEALGRHLVYAPLRQAAFVANTARVNLQEGIHDKAADPSGSLKKFLHLINLFVMKLTTFLFFLLVNCFSVFSLNAQSGNPTTPPPDSSKISKLELVHVAKAGRLGGPEDQFRFVNGRFETLKKEILPAVDTWFYVFFVRMELQESMSLGKEVVQLHDGKGNLYVPYDIQQRMLGNYALAIGWTYEFPFDLPPTWSSLVERRKGLYLKKGETAEFDFIFELPRAPDTGALSLSIAGQDFGKLIHYPAFLKLFPDYKVQDELPPAAALTTLQVQEILKNKGYDPGTLDGKWGAKTTAALKSFQKAKNLSVTGQLDEPTKSELLKSQ